MLDEELYTWTRTRKSRLPGGMARDGMRVGARSFAMRAWLEQEERECLNLQRRCEESVGSKQCLFIILVRGVVKPCMENSTLYLCTQSVDLGPSMFHTTREEAG